MAAPINQQQQAQAALLRQRQQEFIQNQAAAAQAAAARNSSQLVTAASPLTSAAVSAASVQQSTLQPARQSVAVQMVRPMMAVHPPGQQQVISTAPPMSTATTSMAFPQQRMTGIPGQGLAPGTTGVVTIPSAPQPPAGGATMASGGNVIINQPAVRPGQPSLRITLPQATMQNMRPGEAIATGQPGTLLMKTESGHFQIIKVPPNTASHLPPGQPVRIANTGMAPASTLAASQTVTTGSMAGLAQQQRLVTATSLPTGGVATAPGLSTAPQQVGAPTAASAAASSGGMGQQMTPDTAKTRCKNFLATLLKLASDQQGQVASNVQTLIQGLIDGKIEPEAFTTRLQRELNSSPQPCLVPFLKKSLPHLRQSLRTGELTIPGIRPPPPDMTLTAGLTPSSIIPAGGSIRPPAGSTVIRPPGAAGLPNSTLGRPPLASLTTGGSSIGPRIRPPIVTRPPPPLIATSSTTNSSTVIRPPGSTSTVIGGGPRPTTIIPSHQTPTKFQPRQSTPLSTPKHALPTAVKSVPPPPSQPPSAASVLNALSSAPNPSMPPPPSTSAVPTSSMYKRPPVQQTPLSSQIKTESTTSSLSAPPPASAFSSAGDEDINDVAAMGGVNLAEESQQMQGATSLIGQQIRSCKDEIFLQTGNLGARIAKLCRDRGLEDPSPEVIALMSHATQDRLKTLAEKLSVIAEHRMDVVRLEAAPQYEVTQDVRGQLRFLGDMDKIEKMRHAEQEKEMLLRAAKWRAKSDDPEKEKLKAKAKEIQRLELEHLAHEKANNTALLAIGGPKKKLRLDDYGSTSAGAGMNSALSSAFGGSTLSTSGLGGLGSRASTSSAASRMGMTAMPTLKRVNARDLMFMMEQEKDLRRSDVLWRTMNVRKEQSKDKEKEKEASSTF